MTKHRSEHVAGLKPWLPWPLSASAWWTRPVRAERLAALRIGVAGCLLVDILTSYRAHLHDFFGSGGLGGVRIFAYYGESPKFNWSLLRGMGDPLLSTIALLTLLGLTGWIALDFLARFLDRACLTEKGCRRWRIYLWAICACVLALGAWARSIGEGSHAWYERFLHPWGEDPVLLKVLFWAWAGGAALLLAGCWTRGAAIATWVLSLSFANANPHIDNAGDTIRNIALFYLMLSPCGAAWSVDHLVAIRFRHEAGPLYVWPWGLRLLLIQLGLIYFVNGLYKATGVDWLEGDSLYFVLGDITLTRVSLAQLHIPYLLTQLLTWSVLAWELSFPLLMIYRPIRLPALWFGVAFHLGILATMELGGFVPYILCLYLPLVPWERIPRP